MHELLVLAYVKELIDTEPIYANGDEWFCVYCEKEITDDIHDESCPWARLRELWNEQ